MKKLLPLLAVATTLFLSSCDKTEKKAEYIVAVSGSDYADDVRIIYETFGNTNELSSLKLSGGEATITATRSFKIRFSATPHTTGDNPNAPLHQTQGDTYDISIYKRKKNGSRGDKMGEGSLVCSGAYPENQVLIEVKW